MYNTNTVSNTHDIALQVKSVKNSVIKEYLCLKKAKLLTNLLHNNFPVPRRPKTQIAFIDVDAISTDTSQSLTDREKTSKKTLADLTPNVSLAITETASTNDFKVEPSVSINEAFIEILLKERCLTLQDHYSKFLPVNDKKTKGVLEVLAKFEQTAFGNCNTEVHQSFLTKLKVVLLAVCASWCAITRYQKCDHIAACLITAASKLSQVPKRLVLEVFKTFSDESFKGIKIRQLRKTKFFMSVDDLLKMVYA